MSKAKSKKKVIALSAVAVSSVAVASYTVSSMAENKEIKDPTALNLNIDKVDRDTVKISVDNITDAIKSLQLSLQIEGGAKFASTNNINWLVNTPAIEKNMRISDDGKYLDLLIVSDNELKKDGSKLDICEIDVEKLDSIVGAKSNGYKIVPRKSDNNTSYTYVVTNTNKSKYGNNIVNSSDDMLKINTPPTISLKEGTINEAIISGKKIEVKEGYDFNDKFKSFVEASDEDGTLDESNITLDGKVNTSVVGYYNVKIVVTDADGDKGEVSAIVDVIPKEIVPEKPNKPETSDTPSEQEKPSTPQTPDTPSESEKPSTPQTPDTPSEPEKPSTPETPDTPSEPEKPSTPETPDTPNVPEEPSTPEIPVAPSNPVIPPSISDKLDTNIVEIVAGNGEKDSPLELTVKEVTSKELNNFLKELKELNPFVESVSKEKEYTVYKVKLENKTTFLAKLFNITKSSDNVYLDIKVKNEQTELLNDLNEFAKETNQSLVIPENQGTQTPGVDNDNNTSTKPEVDNNQTNSGSNTNNESTKPNNSDITTNNVNTNNPQSGEASILGYVSLGAIASGALFVNLRKKKNK